jgi:hypothetical protein
MCDMKALKKIGVRELRQNLSVHYDRRLARAADAHGITVWSPQ